MAEQEMEIHEQGQYKNIQLKPKRKKGIKGLEIGNHFFANKTSFAEGKEFQPKQEGWSPSFLCKIEYKGEEVSFWLNNAKEVKSFNSAGGVGDKIKISAFEEESVNPMTGGKTLWHRLKFEQVE